MLLINRLLSAVHGKPSLAHTLPAPWLRQAPWRRTSINYEYIVRFELIRHQTPPAVTWSRIHVGRTGRYHSWIGSDERGHRRSNAAMRELVLTMMGFVTFMLAGAGLARAFRGCLAVAPVGGLSEGLRMDAWYGLKSKCTGLVPDRFGATLGRPAQSLYTMTSELPGFTSSCRKFSVSLGVRTCEQATGQDGDTMKYRAQSESATQSA